MKYFSSLITLILLSFSISKSQDYIPLVQEGATWIYKGYGDLSDYHRAFHIIGQEERNGKRYHRLVAYDIVDQVAIPSYLSALLREENKKIYGYLLKDFSGLSPDSDYYCNQPDQEVLYYDFDLNIGDTMDMCIVLDQRYPIGRIYQEFSYGKERMIYEPEEERGAYLIEGLGTEMGLFHFFGIFYHAEKGISLWNHCVGSIEDCIEPSSTDDLYSEGLDIYPNPASDQIRMNISLDSYSILNLQGQTLCAGKNYTANTEINVSNIPEGVYILSANKDDRFWRERIIIK